MLQISKSTTIIGTSRTSEGQDIATMHCSIPDKGTPSYTDTIVNKELYVANAKTVRAEQDQFRAYCREIEDALATENEVSE